MLYTTVVQKMHCGQVVYLESSICKASVHVTSWMECSCILKKALQNLFSFSFLPFHTALMIFTPVLLSCNSKDNAEWSLGGEIHTVERITGNCELWPLF